MVLKNRLWRVGLFFGIFILVAVFSLLQVTWAQSEVKHPAAKLTTADREEKFSPTDSELQMPIAELKHYMKEKYNVDEIGARDEIDPSLKSKKRIIIIRGDLTPKKSFVAKEGKYGLPRAAAEMFLVDEAERLFGIKNFMDIRESNANGDQYSIVIDYQRYVGDLPLQDAIIQVGSREDGRLADVTAYLIPVTEELLEAVTRETLPEIEIRRVVTDDRELMRKQQDTVVGNRQVNDVFPMAVLQPPIVWIEKSAIPVPPYVVWEVKTDWVYTIDAFSGKILKKLQGWQE